MGEYGNANGETADSPSSGKYCTELPSAACGGEERMYWPSSSESAECLSVDGGGEDDIGSVEGGVAGGLSLNQYSVDLARP